MEVTDALRALGGAARWKQLAGLVGRRALQRSVRCGEVSLQRGMYSLQDAERGTILARLLRGVRSHRTAAGHWAFALPPDRPGHDITIPSQSQRRNVPSDARIHYRDYVPDDVIDGVTSPACTVIDCLRDLSLAEALSVGDSALRSGKVTYDELAARANLLRGPGAALVRARLAMLDARAENAFESCCRAILLEAGIVGFEPQVEVRHKGRWIGRVDLAHRSLRILIECDGFATHGTRDAMLRDCIRHTRLVAAGWRPLRFTWEQVMFEPEWVLERVIETIEAVRAERPAARHRSGRLRAPLGDA